MSSPPVPRLITIRASHYCEKARWGLERAGVAFTEESHPPLLHYGATMPVARQRTVPVLRTAHGTLGDSRAILAFADRALAEPARLYPFDHALRKDVESLEGTFDHRLGPAMRRLAYFHLLTDLDLFAAVLTEGTNLLEATTFRLGRRVFAEALRRGLRIDEEGARRSRERLDGVFAEVETRLRDGRRYLTGDRFTAADLTFAALAAPMLRPLEHGVPLADAAARIPSYRAESDRYRATAAGAFVLRLYREDRRRVVPA